MKLLCAVLAVALACGYAIGETTGDATLSLYPVLHESAEGRAFLDVGIEIQNQSDEPTTYILPQDGSYWGWLDPKYVFTLRNEKGEALSLPPRCGNFGGRYDEATMVSVGPSRRLYIMAHRIPFAITEQKKLTISLTYSVSNPRQNKDGHGKAEEPWAQDVFVGTVTSPETAVDLSLSPPDEDHVNLGLAHTNGLPLQGKTENGLSLVLYPAKLKTQQWADTFAAFQVFNRSGKVVSLSGWAMEFNWYDAQGREVPSCQYAGDNLWYRGELPSDLRPACNAYSQVPIGFQKTTGTYKVSVDLLVDGNRRATSNRIEVEVLRNPILEKPTAEQHGGQISSEGAPIAPPTESSP